PERGVFLSFLLSSPSLRRFREGPYLRQTAAETQFAAAPADSRPLSKWIAPAPGPGPLILEIAAHPESRLRGPQHRRPTRARASRTSAVRWTRDRGPGWPRSASTKSRCWTRLETGRALHMPLGGSLASDSRRFLCSAPKPA